MRGGGGLSERTAGAGEACYEAGPTGFALYRAASAAGIAIEVVAPGKTPLPSGDRVKTDRMDAERLAKRRGSQVAKVAVARKILTLCFYGLRDGEIRCLAPRAGARTIRTLAEP